MCIPHISKLAFKLQLVINRICVVISVPRQFDIRSVQFTRDITVRLKRTTNAAIVRRQAQQYGLEDISVIGAVDDTTVNNDLQIYVRFKIGRFKTKCAFETTTFTEASYAHFYKYKSEMKKNVWLGSMLLQSSAQSWAHGLQLSLT